MNLDQAKAIALTKILDKLGFKPIEENESDVTYLSPFKEDGTSRFFVNKKDNVWFDHNERTGGDNIAFVCKYLKKSGEDDTREDARRWISNMFENRAVNEKKSRKKIRKAKWKLIRWEPLEDLALIRYLTDRGINIEYAQKHLVEVYIKSTKTNERYYAIGFKNEDGGYEVKNSFLTSYIGSRMISVVPGKNPYPPNVHIFKDFIDYTTFLTLRHGQHNGQAIVLNSKAGIKQAIPFIKKYGYRTVQTWLDNSPAGDIARGLLQAIINTEENLRHSPMNKIYRDYTSLNDWHLQNPGQVMEEKINEK